MRMVGGVDVERASRQAVRDVEDAVVAKAWRLGRGVTELELRLALDRLVAAVYLDCGEVCRAHREVEVSDG